MMFQDPRYQIQVEAVAAYIAKHSDPAVNRYVFTYTVVIKNQGTLPAQLIERFWKITNSVGQVREVHGDGVVGEQPTLVPGDQFTYTSGAILETPAGTMEGYFNMISADGENFRAVIPLFPLINPSALH